MKHNKIFGALLLSAVFLGSAHAQVKVGVVSSATGPIAMVGIPQKNTVALCNRSLSGVLLPPPSARNNPSDVHHGGVGSDQGDSDQQQVAAA